MKFKPMLIDYDYRLGNFFSKKFYEMGFQETVRMAELKGNETVLDFGCTNQDLKNFLPCGINYIGFDIIEKDTDYKKYEDITKKIDVVFAVDTFDHAGREETEKFLEWCRKKKIQKIVLSTPMDTIVSKLLRWIVGSFYIVKAHHVLDITDLIRILSKYYGNKKSMKSIWLMKMVSLWELGVENTK